MECDEKLNFPDSNEHKYNCENTGRISIFYAGPLTWRSTMRWFNHPDPDVLKLKCA
jgi:hypothetical protein